MQIKSLKSPYGVIFCFATHQGGFLRLYFRFALQVMQFSFLLIDKYISYMQQKHAVVISRQQAERELNQLADFHDSFLRDGSGDRLASPDRPEGGLT